MNEPEDRPEYEESQEDPAPPTSCRVTGPGCRKRLRRVITFLPHWAIALLLLCPPLAMIFFSDWSLRLIHYVDIPWDTLRIDWRYFLIGLALFLPGAIKRWRGRDVLVMFALAFGWFVIDVAAQLLPFVGAEVYWLLSPVRTVLLICLGEWCLTRAGTKRQLVAALLACVVVSCLTAIASVLLMLIRVRIYIPEGTGGRCFPYHTLTPVVLALLTWLILPLALRLGKAKARLRKYLALVVPAGAVGAYVLFWSTWIYSLAHMTMRGVGPFNSAEAACLLGERGRPEDLAAIWKAVETTDWQVWEWYSGGRDIRESWIEALARRLPKETANHLAAMLQQRHPRPLVQCSAKLLGEYHQYRAAPVLMWYAMDFTCSIDGVCSEALETMNVPQAALPILINPYLRQKGVGDPDNLRMTADARQRLIRLLGHDAGPMWKDWTQYCDKVIAEHPKQLPEAWKSVIEDVYLCAMDYLQWRYVVIQEKRRLYRRRLVEAGFGHVLKEFIRLWDLVDSGQMNRHEMRRRIASDRNTAHKMMDICKQVDTDMRVPCPKWDEGSVAELHKQLDLYRERVRAKLIEHFPEYAKKADEVSSQPATSPATTPAATGQPQPQR